MLGAGSNPWRLCCPGMHATVVMCLIFATVGRSLDEAPGDAFDKTARRLNLKSVPECQGLSGGAAVELMAKQGTEIPVSENPYYFEGVPQP